MRDDLPEDMARVVRYREALREAGARLTRSQWVEIFTRHNGSSYRGYAYHKWPEVSGDPLGYLAYWSGPKGAEIAAEVWALLRDGLREEMGAKDD